MLQYLRAFAGGRCAARENAQAMIFFALVSGILALTMGLAIEGGRAFVEYRRMQAAADMAAIVGAQDLPCGLTDTSCMQAAEKLACQTAASNGFSDCSNGTGPGAFVPPVTCSPYDSLDYGNDNGDPSPYGNPNCKSTSAGVNSYDYIEVQLSDNLGVVPIFNTPVTLAAHAVARHGVPSPKDYAVAQLDPSGSLTTSNGAEFFVNGATFANGAMSIGTGSTGCEGGFFTASNSSVGSEITYSGGEAGYAPPACYTSTGGTPTADNPTNFQNNLPPITDTYCTSFSPPVSQVTALYPTVKSTDDCTPASPDVNPQTSITNCPDCNQNGWYYQISGSQATGWYGGGTGTPPSINFSGASGHPNVIEMFPGVYGGFQVGNVDQVYMNPGVYTFTGQVSLDKGEICVYGSPSCLGGAAPNPGGSDPLGGNCGSTNWVWKPGGALGNTWYYYCSPYGYWDGNSINGTPVSGLLRPASVPAAGQAVQGTVACPNVAPVGPSCTSPTWWDASTQTSSSIPLNGVTFFFVPGQGTLKGTGAANSPLDMYLPTPDPCPGTGSGFAAGDTSVSFNRGDSQAVYTYPPGSLASQRGMSQSPIFPGYGSLVYPSMDLSLAGECRPDNLELWPGEFNGKGQHLHFLIFDRSVGTANTELKMAGNQGQALTGIFYTPHELEDIKGGGQGAGGPPFITGQIVSWDISYGGNAAIDLIYRPCDKQDVCASGLGTQLVQ